MNSSLIRPIFKCYSDLSGRSWDNMSFKIENNWRQFVIHTNCSYVHNNGDSTKLELVSDSVAIKWLVESVEEIVDHFIDTFFNFIAEYEIPDHSKRVSLWRDCVTFAASQK